MTYHRFKQPFEPTFDNVDPRGHDYQQAQWLWLAGYRQFYTHGWKQRVLRQPWDFRRQREQYTTLRTFEAFKQTEARIWLEYLAKM